MKRTLLIFTLFLSLCCLLNMPFIDVVNAEIGDITIENWQLFNDGETSGSGSYFNWSSDKTTNFFIEDSHAFSNRVLKGFSGGNGQNYNCWFNMTKDLGYVSSISMLLDFDISDPGSGADFHAIIFYNNGTEVLNIPIWQSTSGTYYDDIKFKDATDTVTMIKANICSWNSGKIYLKISHKTGNEMNYTVINQANSSDYTTVNGSCRTVANWSTFDQIKVYIDGTFNGGSYVIWIDDIVINQNENEESGLPEVTGAIVWHNGNLGVQDVLVGSSNIYVVNTTGDVGRKARCTISDPDGKTVLNMLIIRANESFFKTYGKIGTYTMIISDFYHPYDNYWISTFDVESDDIIDYYESEYGDFYVEFYNTGENCYYEVGMRPKIVYKVNDTYINAGQFLPPVTPFYQLEIVKSDNVVVYTAQIRSNDTVDILWPEYVFGMPVEYVLRLWNMTYAESGGFMYYAKKDIVWESYPARVCPEGSSDTEDTDNDGIPNEIDNAPNDWNPDQADTDEDGIPDVIDPQPTVPNQPPEDFGHGLFPKIDGALGAILGMCITIACLIIPLLIGGQVGADVPMLAYAISGGIGIAVSTILGLFPSWIIFFLVAIGLIVVFLMYIANIRGAGES
jgi:glutaredoxin-related protein